MEVALRCMSGDQMALFEVDTWESGLVAGKIYSSLSTVKSNVYASDIRFGINVFCFAR